jgi:hypothetical protein
LPLHHFCFNDKTLVQQLEELPLIIFILMIKLNLGIATGRVAATSFLF